MKNVHFSLKIKSEIGKPVTQQVDNKLKTDLNLKLQISYRAENSRSATRLLKLSVLLWVREF